MEEVGNLDRGCLDIFVEEGGGGNALAIYWECITIANIRCRLLETWIEAV